MEGKIVYQGKSKKGTEIIIRYPEPTDTQAMTDYINTLSDERTFITYQGEHETLESETKYLVGQIDKIRKKRCIQLLVFANNKLIGISVGKKFRGEGIGQILIENVIKEAIKSLPDLEIITLGVFSGNIQALNWYKKLGFVEEGRLPNGAKLENGYQDHIYMYKTVK